MARRSFFAFAAAATLVLTACTEREPQSTTGPDFAPGTDPCGFSNSLVTGYFPSSRQSYMLSVKSSMASAVQAAQKRTLGFELMDSIGSVSRNTAFSTDPAAGAQLTIAIIGCVFPGISFTYPTNALADFTKALNSAAGGAYFVRGGGSSFADRGATILGTTGGVAGNLSGIKPSTGSSAADWTTMLNGNGTLVQQGVLFYGYNAATFPTDPVLYEWASVPSELTFNPAAVVSVCDENPTTNPVVHEEAVGVLFFVTSDICGTQQSLTMAEPGWGPKALAARLGRVLADALTPTPLQATTTLVIAGSGKTSTLPKSKFGKKSLTAVTSTWKNSPLDLGSTWYGTTKAQARPVSAYVSATADGNTEAVRFCAYLTGANNNGTPTQLMKDPGPQQAAECTSPPNADTKALSVVTTPDPSDDTRALADFGNVWVTKTGTITITLTVSSGTSVTPAPLSAVLYVKPLKK